MTECKLRVEDIYLRFGGIEVLNGISIEVNKGEILGIVGPNGAGKTALLNCVNGFYKPQQGTIYFDGRDITGLRPNQIARLGIGRSFQQIQLYAGLNVVDNLMSGRHNAIKYGLGSSLIYFGKAHSEEMKQRRVVEEIIELLELQTIRKEIVATLGYGLRKRVDLARALTLNPILLLLDEPMAGMNVEEKEDMARFIIDAYELWSMSIVLIEHDIEAVLDISDRIVVLDYGKKIAEGIPKEIMTNPDVIKAYLGGETVTGG